MSARILVVDDDPKITSFLKRGLAFEGYSVDVAMDGQAALKLALEKQPDLVILDIMMPGIDGYEVARRLRAGDEQMPILMLTARDEVADRVQGLDSGADDYLVKPFAYEELLARVRALLRRSQQNNGNRTTLRYADLTLDTSTREVRRGDRLIELTNTEFELLALLLRHPRQVLSRATLLEQVWGYDSETETNVVEVYIGYLRQKLEASQERRLIHTMRGAGYVLREA